MRRSAGANHFLNCESMVRDVGVLLQHDVWGSAFGSRGATVRRSKSILNPATVAMRSGAQPDATKRHMAHSCTDLLKSISS